MVPQSHTQKQKSKTAIKQGANKVKEDKYPRKRLPEYLII